MYQVLFHIPLTAGLFPPAGLPVYGFGAMLFATFVVTALLWGPRRGEQVGLPRDRLTDLALVLFLTGIAGARIVYMIQYSSQFPADWPGRIKAFFQVWNGGIVVYGAVFGGLLGYAVFYRLVVRKRRVNGWKLADAVAPLIAAGMAIGRIGCYLNGCCWGQPVCAECQVVPLAPELGQFPLLTAHARDQVCTPARGTSRMPQIHGLQTSTGFAIAAATPFNAAAPGDPRSLVVALEPDSPAARAGLQVGDRILTVNGKPNGVVVELRGPLPAVADALARAAAPAEPQVVPNPTGLGGRSLIRYPKLDDYRAAAPGLAGLRDAGVLLDVTDDLNEAVEFTWPRGQSELALGVDRAGAESTLAFTPKTVSFYPTQLYETVSMVLLVLVLVTFQPLRRHDGQVMVMLMVGYAAHRFLNEAIRIEPTYQAGLTLSQWISVGILGAALGLELYLRRTMPKLPPGPLPLSHGVTPAAPTENGLHPGA